MKRLIERLLWEGSLHRIRRRNGPIPNPVGPNAYFHCFGLLFNPKAMWVGVHYSAQHKRTCINLIPCFTIWHTAPGGQLP